MARLPSIPTSLRRGRLRLAWRPHRRDATSRCATARGDWRPGTAATRRKALRSSAAHRITHPRALRCCAPPWGSRLRLSGRPARVRDGVSARPAGVPSPPSLDPDVPATAAPSPWPQPPTRQSGTVVRPHAPTRASSSALPGPPARLAPLPPAVGSDPRGACAEARPVPAPAGIRRAAPHSPCPSDSAPFPTGPLVKPPPFLGHCGLTS